MTQFELWVSNTARYCEPTSWKDCEAAFLAGQASVEQRVQALEATAARYQHSYNTAESERHDAVMLNAEWKRICASKDERIAELARERDHWKSNHDNRVEAARILIERDDLPFERVAAYKTQVALQLKCAELEQKLAVRSISAVNFENAELSSKIEKLSGLLDQCEIEVGKCAALNKDLEADITTLQATNTALATENEALKAQAGEPVAWMNKSGSVISAKEKSLIIENGKLGRPGGEFDLHAKSVERSYTIPLGVIND